MKKTLINTAIVAALAASAPAANAAVQTFNWTGVFTMLDSAGGALENTSNPNGKSGNNYQTSITGTMAFDTLTGAGTATLVPFDFFSGSLPAEAVGINMQAIGNGMGGAGSLVLGNMLFNWDGKNGIPVSLVMDAAGFFGSTAGMWADYTLTQSEVAGFGAIPASDGTYTGLTFGYLNLGPAPMVTLSTNTSNSAACVYGVDANFADNVGGGCMGVGTNGVLPLVADTTANGNDYDITTPTYSDLANDGIGGNPMQDGPFQNFSANFEVLSLTMTNPDAGGSIAPNCDFDPSGNLCKPSSVPVPAAVWLFGSGLLGLVGVARRKKSAV